MISRFIFCALLFAILIGFAIHSHFDIPFVKDWVGKLPGDIVFTRGNSRVDFPLASGAIASILYCIIHKMLFSKN